jgi:pimeloyl-ACP methyl ester carboxylesterase
LAAFGMLMPSDNLSLTIIGDGPDRRRLHRIASRTCSDRVRFAGFVTDDDLAHYYESSDIFSMPSPAELECVAALEALSYGLPIVAPRAGALAELAMWSDAVKQYESVDSPRQLADCLTELAADKIIRATMAQRAIEASKRRSISATTDQWRVVYDRLQRHCQSKRVDIAEVTKVTSATAIHPWRDQVKVCIPGRGIVTMLRSYPASPATVTLVLLHGIVVDSVTCWSGVAAELADEFSVLAIDCYGHGSVLADGQTFTLEGYADDVLTVLSALKVTNPLIVGHSLGGAIAQLVTRKSIEDDSISLVGAIFSSTAARFSTTIRDWFFYQWIRFSRQIVQLVPKRGQVAFGAWYSKLRGLTKHRYFDDKNFDWSVLFDVAEKSCEFNSSGWIRESIIPGYAIITTKGDVVSVKKQRELAELAGVKSVDVDLPHDYCMTDPHLYANNLKVAISSLLCFTGSEDQPNV